MPAVTGPDNFRVSPSGGGAGTFSAPATENFAAVQAGQMGAAIQGASSQLGDVAKQAQQQANQLRVIEAENRAREVANHLTYDEKEGYQSVKGGDVVNMPSGQPLAQDYAGRYRQSLQEIAGGLANDQQRQMFNASAGPLATSFEAGATQHEASEYRNWAVSTQKGALDLLTQKWGKDPMSVVPEDIERFNASAHQLARLHGISGNEEEGLRATSLSAAITQSIGTALDEKNTAGAKYLFQTMGSSLLGPDRARIEAVLKRQDTQQTAMGLGDNFEAVLTRGLGVPGTPTQTGTPSGPVDWHHFFNEFVAKHEGGAYVIDSNGYGVKWGINAKYHPGLDIEHLTKAQAESIFMADYVRKSGADKIANPATAMQHADMYYLNETQAGKILDRSGGDPAKYTQMRQRFLDGLATSNPGKWGRYQRGWTNRTNDLAHFTQTAGGQSVNENTGQIDVSPEAAMQWVRAQLPPDVDPETRQAAEQRVLWVLANHKAGVAQATEQNLGGVYKKLVANGGDMEKLTPPELAAIPAAEMPHVIGFADTIHKNEDPETDPATYQAFFGHPELHARMTDSQLYALKPKMADKDFRAAVDAVTSARQAVRQGVVNAAKTAGNVDYGAVDKALSPRLQSIGINPSPGAKDNEGRAHVGAIQMQVHSAVLSAQARLGRQLNDAEMQQVVDRQIMAQANHGGGMFSSPTQRPLFLTTYKDIAHSEREQIENDLRSHGIPVNEANVLRVFYDKGTH